MCKICTYCRGWQDLPDAVFYNLDAILQDAGKITAEFAKRFAESEFEKYRIIQDKLFQSDFDRLTHGELPSFEIE